MQPCLSITPSGHLRVEEASALEPALAEPAADALRVAFGESTGAGLLLLATRELDHDLPADFVFWKGFARDFFQRVCHLGDAPVQQWAALPEPGEDALIRLVAEAPPMRGLEYLSAERLRELWRELRALAVERATAHRDGPAAWLQTVHPLWRLLGRVTFHLAENKRDPNRPFAFLATFTHRLSSQARLQHLPLAEPLKAYAGAKEKAKLAALLEPVRRAAEQSSLVRELLDFRGLFAPQAWTIREAHRFLKESLVIEQAGVVVRVPDWWSARTPPRPQVQVSLGTRPASMLSLDNMLDFQVGLAIDGAPLTDEERRQLLKATDGLALLRGKWVEVDHQQIQEALDHWKALENKHAQGISFIEGMRLLAGARLDTGAASDATVADWSHVSAGPWLRETLERMRHPETIDACQPGRELQATLRPYQVEGVRWLWFMTELGLGGCLADDMGLGKTIQVIDLLLLRKRQAASALALGKRQATAKPRAAGPSLLVVPASLIGNWRQELARFAPSLKIFFAHRSECSAETLAEVERDPAVTLAQFDLVVTTYGLARRQSWLEKLRWPLAILDEAQAIKNAGSTQTRAVKKLSAGCRLVPRSVDSLIDLLQGRFDQGIMERLSRCDGGLFPQPREIKMKCSCPDWAGMCKHVAATLYGVGARLDTAPELLFTLRDVDHLELISQAVDAENLSEAFQGKSDSALGGANLGEIFGIEIEGDAQPAREVKPKEPRPRGNPKPVATKRRPSRAPKKATAAKKHGRSAARS